MIRNLKQLFNEIFTLMAWITLLSFVVYCTVTDNKTDSVRDAWNILILIAGFVWGSSQKNHTSEPAKPGTTTAEISGTITTESEN